MCCLFFFFFFFFFVVVVVVVFFFFFTPAVIVNVYSPCLDVNDSSTFFRSYVHIVFV